jgi:hypothetical protein
MNQIEGSVENKLSSFILENVGTNLIRTPFFIKLVTDFSLKLFI